MIPFTALQDQAGPFYVMLDFDQSVSEHATLQEARESGQRACDAEPLPCAFSIHDADGNHIEEIARSDGASLADRVAAFAAAHRA